MDVLVVGRRDVGSSDQRMPDDRHANAFETVTCEGLGERARNAPHGIPGDRICRIVSCDGAKDERGVLGTACNRSNGIVARSKRQHAVATHQRERRPQTHQAAGSRWSAHRRARVLANAHGSEVRRHSRTCAARRSTRMASGSYGFRIGPDIDPAYPEANSPIVAFPMMMAPASRSLFTTVASRAGMKSLNTADPYVVTMSDVSS